MKLAEFQGKVQEYKKEFHEAADDLENDWEDTKYKDKSQVDALIKKTTEQVIETFRRFCKKTSKQQARQVEDLLQRASQAGTAFLAVGQPDLIAAGTLSVSNASTSRNTSRYSWTIWQMITWKLTRISRQ